MTAELDKLAADLAQARHDEALAKSKRLELEKAIEFEAPFKTGVKSQTIKTGNGLKLTIKRGTLYKLLDGKKAMSAGVPVKEETKYSLDSKAYEALRETDPEAFKKASEFVEVKPAKTSVTLAVV